MMKITPKNDLFHEIKNLLNQAQVHVVKTVNSTIKITIMTLVIIVFLQDSTFAVPCTLTIELKKELNTLNLATPYKDVLENIVNEKYQFIGLNGYTNYFPGVDPSDIPLISQNGFKIINGTSDTIESKEHEVLMNAAKEYAISYNGHLLTFLKKHRAKPKNGFVPDEETAIQIAIAVWIPIYGKKEINNEKPFSAHLKDGVWYVSGSLPEDMLGGVAEAEILQTNGGILRVSHEK